MSADGQHTKWRKNIAENFIFLSRVHECYRQQTDRWVMKYSEQNHSIWTCTSLMEVNCSKINNIDL